MLFFTLASDAMMAIERDRDDSKIILSRTWVHNLVSFSSVTDIERNMI